MGRGIRDLLDLLVLLLLLASLVGVVGLDTQELPSEQDVGVLVQAQF